MPGIPFAEGGPSKNTNGCPPSRSVILRWKMFSACQYACMSFAICGSDIPLISLYLPMEGLKIECKDKNKSGGLTSAFQVRMEGLEPPRLAALDPKSSAATNYATCACCGANIQCFFEYESFSLLD